MAATLLISPLPALMLVAAMHDLASYRIPNWISLALLVAFLVAFPFSSLGWSDLGLHALVGLGALAAGFALFALGMVGGGDAKLFAAGALWLGLEGLAPYAFGMALTGGVMCTAILAVRRLAFGALLPPWGWVEALRDETNGVPYGVAIAGGAILALPATDWMSVALAAA